MAFNAASHLDPLRVLAQVPVKTPINRGQWQLLPALYPIAFNLKNGKFWFTEQIPLAIVEFE